MRLLIHHETRYAYASPATNLVQAVRLTPAPHDGQKIRNWQVRGAAGQALAGYRDGFGNWVQLHRVADVRSPVCLTVTGDIETIDTKSVISGAQELLSLEFYCAPSAFTQADAALTALAHADRAADPLDALHRLMARIRAAVDYIVDTTSVEFTAAQALARGSGVCQDHAHVMIAAARIQGLPARYVSGYLWIPDQAVSVASYAWMEAHVAGLGWVGFDPANCVCPGTGYVRLAVGRDYADAAPVRGVRTGGGAETLDVSVSVQVAQQ